MLTVDDLDARSNKIIFLQGELAGLSLKYADLTDEIEDIKAEAATSDMVIGGRTIDTSANKKKYLQQHERFNQAVGEKRELGVKIAERQAQIDACRAQLWGRIAILLAQTTQAPTTLEHIQQ